MKKRLPLGEIKKVLFMRIDGLGDVVMSTPAISRLREIFPISYITLLAASLSKDIVETIPTFDEIIYFDAPWIMKEQSGKLRNLFRCLRRIRAENFDLIIDLRGDFRNNVFMYFCNAKYRIGFDHTGCDFLLTHVIPKGNNHHMVSASLSLVNYLQHENIEKIPLQLWISSADRDFADGFLKKNGIDCTAASDRLVVVIHPGAKWYGRRWKSQRYAAVADALIENYDARVILAGSPSDVEMTRDIARLMKHTPIEAAGKTSLRQFLALLEKSDLFIGLDSGPMHMAVAMGTRLVALFGPARPESVGPWGDKYIVVTHQERFSCSPCTQTVCAKLDNSCMDAISADEVWEAARKQINEVMQERKLR